MLCKRTLFNTKLFNIFIYLIVNLDKGPPYLPTNSIHVTYDILGPNHSAVQLYWASYILFLANPKANETGFSYKGIFACLEYLRMQLCMVSTLTPLFNISEKYFGANLLKLETPYAYLLSRDNLQQPLLKLTYEISDFHTKSPFGLNRIR